MKIVIQCAGRKKYDAGSMESLSGKPVMFVARPDKAPPDGKHTYARPDDISDDGKTWRERLLDYNKYNAKNNPYGILPAWQLYTNPAYADLVLKFGLGKIFILSAGWGLIPANFLTAVYDITFSGKSQPFNRRRRKDKYLDFCMLPDDGEDVVFLGGKSYLPLFYKLTTRHKGRKSILYNSMYNPALPLGFESILYKTSTRQNWHYECAKALIDNEKLLGAVS
ncbi:MAG: hypothetical protein KGI29_04925 [Pseudomonadota bacterium]|nr:hypothetical protein [Pseudomonadota bacterium]MDE3038464.1 hypothetical protein [Pseudomonadota bacterium]